MAHPRSIRSLVGAIALLSSFPHGARASDLPTLPGDPPPVLTQVELPAAVRGEAIWGATGRDAQGHIWFAVSAGDVDGASAEVWSLDPQGGAFTARGDVVSQLRRAGLDTPGVRQNKIHTKFVEGTDGWLYFASTDEQGEAADGSRGPEHGSHLWRVEPDSGEWQHLAAFPFGIVAMAGGAGELYALGYFGHILVHLDPRTGETRSVRVGSIGGHVSRNLVVDPRGHAYVPRVVETEVKGMRRTPGVTRSGSKAWLSTLVEFDAELNEIGETPLDYYDPDPTDRSHGIVGVTELSGARSAFTTHTGRMYVIEPGAGDAPARVRDAGSMHPLDGSYPAALYPVDGGTRIAAVAGRDRNGRGYSWLVLDPETRRSRIAELRMRPDSMAALPSLLLYGSDTRSSDGSGWVVGAYKQGGEFRPILARLSGR